MPVKSAGKQARSNSRKPGGQEVRGYCHCSRRNRIIDGRNTAAGWVNRTEHTTIANAAPADRMNESNENSIALANNTMGKMAKTMCWSSDRTSPLCMVTTAKAYALSRNPVRAVIPALPGARRRRRKTTPPAIKVASNRTLPSSVIVAGFFQAEDGIRDYKVTGVQTCALPI